VVSGVNCYQPVRAAPAARGELVLVRFEALALVEERHGPQSPRLLAPCVELARVLTLQGRRDEGARFLDRAKELPELRQSQKKMLVELAKELSMEL